MRIEVVVLGGHVARWARGSGSWCGELGMLQGGQMARGCGAEGGHVARWASGSRLWYGKWTCCKVCMGVVGSCDADEASCKVVVALDGHVSRSAIGARRSGSPPAALN